MRLRVIADTSRTFDPDHAEIDLTLDPVAAVELITRDGRAVRVTLDENEDGPYIDPSVRLSGVNCNLDGILPGEYALVQRGSSHDRDGWTGRTTSYGIGMSE